jgi:hypothetical protein
MNDDAENKTAQKKKKGSWKQCSPWLAGELGELQDNGGG